MVTRLKAAADAAGADSAALAGIATALGVSWLPLTALENVLVSYSALKDGACYPYRQARPDGTRLTRPHDIAIERR